MKASIRKINLKKGYSYSVYIEYGDIKGKRKREYLETFSKKGDAEQYRNKIQSEIENNTFIRIPDITFSEAIDEWMENYVSVNCEPNTAESYRVVNEKYLKPCLGHIPLKVIGSPNGIDIINDYYKYLRFDLEKEFIINEKSGKKKQKKNLSYSSVDHHKAQISGVFTYFVSKKQLTSNICINTVVPKTDEEKMKDTVIDDIENYEDEDLYEDKEFITPQQAVEVLNLFMNTEMMVPVFLATMDGLRRSEIAGLLKSKVDIENRRLAIQNVRVRCGKDTIFKKRNKNKTSTRYLYFPQIIADILKLDEQRIERNKLLYGDEYIDSKFLCVMDNGQPIKVEHISRKFKKVFDKFLEENKKKDPNFDFPYITLHKLRHLNISSLLANGAYITDVKDNAGHSNIGTTMHYTHTYTEGKKDIADRIDEIYSPLFKIKIG